MFALYADARKQLIASPAGLIACERFIHNAIQETLREHLLEFREDSDILT